jgi:hypothetical protein
MLSFRRKGARPARTIEIRRLPGCYKTKRRSGNPERQFEFRIGVALPGVEGLACPEKASFQDRFDQKTLPSDVPSAISRFRRSSRVQQAVKPRFDPLSRLHHGAEQTFMSAVISSKMSGL